MVILFSVPSHGRHQMGVNSGLQWDRARGCIIPVPADTKLVKLHAVITA